MRWLFAFTLALEAENQAVPVNVPKNTQTHTLAVFGSISIGNEKFPIQPAIQILNIYSLTRACLFLHVYLDFASKTLLKKKKSGITFLKNLFFFFFSTITNEAVFCLPCGHFAWD